MSWIKKRRKAAGTCANGARIGVHVAVVRACGGWGAPARAMPIARAGAPARPMRRNAARLKYRRRCVATRMNERARAHPAERGECRGRSMTRRARQGDRPRAERMRAASRASAAGLPRASRRRHLTRRRATGADFHPSAARRRGVRGSRRHGRGRRGRGGRRANGFAGRAPRRYPCSGGSAAARGRTRSRAGAFGCHRPHSAACRVLVRYAPPSSRAALAGASHRPITPSAS